ncbi:mCG1035631 [Mus musculus]|jgi:hypothetical protein|nr:mCG1035631 [Mus musculus]
MPTALPSGFLLCTRRLPSAHTPAPSSVLCLHIKHEELASMAPENKLRFNQLDTCFYYGNL